MTVKILLSAFAVAAALAIGAPAFAQDKDMDKSMDHPAHHHHHAIHHHAAMHHEHMEHHAMHHRMHGTMSEDAKERMETKRLNEEQLHKSM